MITRKDVAEANTKLTLGRKANHGLTTPSEHLVRSDNLPFIPYGAYDETVNHAGHSGRGAGGGGGSELDLDGAAAGEGSGALGNFRTERWV